MENDFTLPLKYDSDEDFWFRTYNIHDDYKKYCSKIKESNLQYKEKSEASKEFLDSLYQTIGIEVPDNLKLSRITAVKELVECERFHEKKGLTTKLEEHHLKKIDELSRFVWGLRFFNHPFQNQLADKLIKEIFHDLKNIDFQYIQDMIIQFYLF